MLQHYYWLFVIVFLCLSPPITQCDEGEKGAAKKEEEKGYWGTFASVAGKVASSAGDTVYSAASSGASTISGMFNGDNGADDDNKNTCDEDGYVQNDDGETAVERTGGIFNTVSNTVGSAWSTAVDGVQSTIAGQVDAVLGAVVSRMATALTPG